MRVLLVNGSPRAKGCTYTALMEVAGRLEKQGVETRLFQLGGAPVRGCVACRQCHRQGLRRCVFDDDIANRLMEEMDKTDGIVIASPVYYAGPNGALCAVLDRAFYADSIALRGKPGAALVSCRRGGSTAALDRLNKYITINAMPLVSSKYWNMVHGNTPEEVRQDEEGMQVMRQLGDNMAWLLRSIQSGGVPRPDIEPPVATNFIR